jgi:hypothetical protein
MKLPGIVRRIRYNQMGLAGIRNLILLTGSPNVIQPNQQPFINRSLVLERTTIYAWDATVSP